MKEDNLSESMLFQSHFGKGQFICFMQKMGEKIAVKKVKTQGEFSESNDPKLHFARLLLNMIQRTRFSTQKLVLFEKVAM